jgi:hypothetical protein
VLAISVKGTKDSSLVVVVKELFLYLAKVSPVIVRGSEAIVLALSVSVE